MMEQPTITLLQRTKIVPNDWNPRRFRKVDLEDQGLQDLAASIRNQGLISPIIVREMPKKRGAWQIVAGERRWRACAIAGMEEIPAMVRELTDEQAFEVTATENLQREDLTPMEEALQYALFVKAKWTIPMIANKIGKSEKFVARRLTLDSLHEDWKKIAEDPKCENFFRSPSHLEEIGRLPEELQIQLAREFKPDDTWGLHSSITLAGLKRLIGDRLHVLRTAQFDIKDATLDSKAGPCASCPQRSDADKQLLLFDADEFADQGPGPRVKAKRTADSGARCLNPACWKRKLNSHLMRTEEAIAKEKGRVILIGEDHHAEGVWKKKDLQHEYDYTAVRADAKGAKPALRVTGPNAGEVYHVLPRYGSRQDGLPRPQKSLKEKLAQHAVMRQRHVTDAIIGYIWEMIKGEREVTGKGLASRQQRISFVYTFGTPYKQDSMFYAYGRDGKVDLKAEPAWQQFWNASESWTEDAMLHELFLSSLRVLIHRLTECSYDGARGEKESASVCEAVGLDYQAITEEVRRQKPYPKSWGVGEDGKPLKTTNKEPRKARKKPAKAGK